MAESTEPTEPTEPTETPAEAETMQTSEIHESAPTPGRRRGPDPLALLVGLATLVMAVFAFVGEVPDLSGLDARWVLAGGAAVVGLALLLGTLRGRRSS